MAFKYPVRVLAVGDDDWPSVVGNLSKARKSWGAVVADIELGVGGSKVSGHFFKAVTQAVLLFGV